MIAVARLTNCHRGFQTTSRANPLAQKILKAEIAQGLNRSVTRYSADNCKILYSVFTWEMTFVSGLFLNGTQMPADFDYNDPSLPYFINGRQDPTSQRFEVEADLIRIVTF
jgi:hypothetical protein